MWLRQRRHFVLCSQIWRDCRSSPPPRLPSLLSSSSHPSPSSLLHGGRPASPQKKCASPIVGSRSSSSCRKTFCTYVNSSTAAVPACMPRVRCCRNISSGIRQPTSSGQGQDDKHNRQEEEALVEGVSEATSKQPEDFQQRRDGIGTLRQFWRRFGSAVKAICSMSRVDWMSKLGHWKAEAIVTLKRYWVGTKLLWTDVRVSSRLLLKLARGKNLSRRERQQLTRTTADMFRLVPFAIFIVVPFMELLLPIFLKVFPNMLPSTFQDKVKEEEAQQRRLNTRMQYAKFLQDTVREMAKELKTNRIGDIKRTAEDLDKFMSRVRKGERVSNDDILGFAKLFNDEITLDNLSRPRLISMCKYMGIKPYGTDAYLCYMLRSKLAWIKNDDKLIQTEGIELLSEAELQAACRERGMLNFITIEEMRQHLKNWVDLSLNHSVPSSLLILSRALSVSGKMKPEEAVQATLSSLPDEVIESVGISELPSEGTLGERMRKLKFIKSQDEMIKKAEESQEDQKVNVKKS